MIRLYFANSTIFQQLFQREQLLAKIPMDMWPRALRYKFKEDSYNYILGRLMLKQGLLDLGFDEKKLEEVKYNNFQKPFLKGVSFSISHSKNMVLCAISKESKVGVDIEVDGKMKMNDLRSFFTEKEWEDIMGTKDRKKRLYQYWTRKESILKAIGTGLAKLEDIHLLDEKRGFHKSQNNLWYFHELDLGSTCTTTLCVDQKDIDVKIIPFRIN